MEEINKMDFWKNASPEAQNENFDVFLDLVNEFNNRYYEILQIFSVTSKSVLENRGSELVALMKEYKDNSFLNQNIWKSIDKEHQSENMQMLIGIIQEMKDRGEDISQIWKDTDKKAQEENLNSVIKKVAVDKESSLQIFSGLNIQPTEDQFKTFLRNSGNKQKDVSNFYNVYQQLFKLNEEINSTINFEIFDDKLLNIFEIDKLARITTYPELENKLVELHNIKGFDNVLKYISKDSNNWSMELDNTVQNVDKYPGLMEKIPNTEIDEHTAKMLVQVFSQKENYFNISDFFDVNNYFDIRENICKKILEEEEVPDLNPVLASYSDEDRKRFAILELMFGIDIDEARNLVEKYGKDIEEIDAEKYGDIAETVLGIKRILECDNIKERYDENKEKINKKLETIEYSSIASLEGCCIDMYSQMYDETLYKVNEEDKIQEVEYEGKKIDVYEINKDFNMFIRVDGACNGFEEPENFAEKYEKSRIRYHGNCKSYISQESISIATTETSARSIKLGYSQSKAGSITLSAPWDIMSNDANAQFSIASAKWNENCGAQFRTPTQMINNTRYGYNEFDCERLIYDEENQEFEKDKPSYIVYIQEPEVDKEQDDGWRMTKKAAKQLGLPIVLVDREKFAKRELEKVEHLEAVFLGREENKENIPETELLEKIVVSFENNATGVRGSKLLSERYFNRTQRTNMIGKLWGKIKEFENTDFKRYSELVDKFVDVLQNEDEVKTHTNIGNKISGKKYGPVLDSLKKKQAECEARGQSKNDGLLQVYSEFGIEKNDLSKSREKLANEANKNRAAKEQEEQR